MITELNKSNIEYELLTNSYCGYVVTDAEGLILKINEVMINWCGLEFSNPNSPIRFSDLLTIGSKLYYDTHYLPLLQIQGYVREINFDLEQRNGENIPILINSITKYDQTTQRQLNYSIIFEIRQRKQYERELLNAKAKSDLLVEQLQKTNKELSQFTYVVSHDLKSPLNNVISIAEMLKEHCAGKLDHEGDLFIDYLIQSSNRLKSLIDSILSYYQSDNLVSGKENVDLVRLFESVHDMLDSKREHQIRYSTPPKSIFSHQAALNQILINLVANALKYNDKPQAIVDIHFSENDQFYCFAVQDNGPGIPEIHLEKIFKLFTNLGKKDRNGEQGTGIGLSTVKKLIERLGGTIEVDSKIGIGSTFRFCLAKA
ncbi:MAG: HAMP domain-containing sensor histidine kinase [Saprospiraceae bacterium]|nr:HAMP domain-containing sensor histidine kinase [Saprospiraceae bacterium]